MSSSSPDVRYQEDFANILRQMEQFFETYRDDEKLAALWRVLSWSHNRIIMMVKNVDEKTFYLQLAIKEKLSVRELERQINAACYQRSLTAPKLSAALREFHPAIGNEFTDNYVQDDEVVEYALSRNLSPTLIAEYQLQLPDKKLIQAKLHELTELELEAKNNTLGEDQ